MNFFEKQNNAKSSINMGGGLLAGGLLLTVANGGEFPAVGDYILTIWDSATFSDPGDDPNMEIVKCTARVGNNLTIVRAQEGTLDVNHNNNDAVLMLVTAGQITQIEDEIVQRDGTIPLTADWDIGAFDISGDSFKADTGFIDTRSAAGNYCVLGCANTNKVGIYYYNANLLFPDFQLRLYGADSAGTSSCFLYTASAAVANTGSVYISPCGKQIAEFHYDTNYQTLLTGFVRISGNAITAPKLRIVEHAITAGNQQEWCNTVSVAYSYVTQTGLFRIRPDTDTTHYIARSQIAGSGDVAYFAHYDMVLATDYAIKQSATGGTYLNAKTGEHIYFNINNTSWMQLDDNGKLYYKRTPVAAMGNVIIGDETIASTNYRVTILAANDAISALLFGDALNAAGEYAGYINYSHSLDQFQFGANSGTQSMTFDSNGLVIDSNSNSRSLRLLGADGATEIWDFYVDAGGCLVISATPGNPIWGFLDIRTEGNEWGIVIRENAGGGTAYANLYRRAGAAGLFNICNGQGNSTLGLLLDTNQNVGLRLTPRCPLDVKSSTTTYLGGMMLQQSGDLATYAWVVASDYLWYGFASNASGADEFGDFASFMKVDGANKFVAFGAGCGNASATQGMINAVSGADATQVDIWWARVGIGNTYNISWAWYIPASSTDLRLYNTHLGIDTLSLNEDGELGGDPFNDQQTYILAGHFLDICSDARFLFGWLTPSDNGTEQDLSYTNNDATYVNASDFTSGDQVKKAFAWELDFDAVDDYLTQVDSNSLSFGNSLKDFAFTFFGWIEVVNTATAQVIYSKYSTVAGALREFQIYLDSSEKINLDCYDESVDITAKIITDAALSVGRHFVVVTYDGRGGATAATGMECYVDGVLVATTETNNANYVAMENTATLPRIGANNDGYYFQGNMGMIGIDASLWSAEDVWKAYIKTRGFYNL